MLSRIKWLWSALLFACLAPVAFAAAPAGDVLSEVKLPAVTITGKTRTTTYSNVTLTVDADNVVMLRHSKGLVTLRFEDLPGNVQRKFTGAPEPPPERAEAPKEPPPQEMKAAGEGESTNQVETGASTNTMSGSVSKGVGMAKDFFQSKRTKGLWGIVGLVAMGIGAVMILIAHLWVLGLAFSENILWGLGSLCTGAVTLIFVLMHWDKTKRPVALFFFGCVVAASGAALAQLATK